MISNSLPLLNYPFNSDGESNKVRIIDYYYSIFSLMAGVTVAISFWLPSGPGREPVRAVSMERVQAGAK